MKRCTKEEFWSKVDSVKEFVRQKSLNHSGDVHGFVWGRVEYKGRWADLCLAAVRIKDISTYLKSLNSPYLHGLRFNID